MSKRVLASLVVALLAVGIFGAVAKAGVEGEFTFHISMWPRSTEYEVSNFDLDFEALLKLNITLSGLTFSNDLAMGIAGLEHYIGNIETILGALTLRDEFAFARPYIGGVYPFIAFSKWTAWWIGGVPVPAPFPIGPMTFVKKRAYGEITIGGLSFTNLVMFEDVNFPEPWALEAPPEVGVCPTTGLVTTVPAGKTCSWTERISYMPIIPKTGELTCSAAAATATGTVTITCIPGNPGRLIAKGGTSGGDFTWPEGVFYDASYTAAQQAFRFGDIIGISGVTVSGIKVTAKTGICADWRIRPRYLRWMGGKEYVYKQLEYARNAIKKKLWTESVCTNPKLEFTKEYLAVEKIAVSDILTFNAYSIIQFLPLSVFTAVESVVNLFNIGTLYLWMDLMAPKDIVIEGVLNPIAILTIGPGLTISWLDGNQDLSISAGDLIYVDHSMSLQNVSLANFLEMTVGTGITYMHNQLDIPISFPEPIGSLTIDAYWDYDPASGHLEFEDIDFGLEKSFGEHNTFAIDALFNEDGLYGVDIEIGVSFSL